MFLPGIVELRFQVVYCCVVRGDSLGLCCMFLLCRGCVCMTSPHSMLLWHGKDARAHVAHVSFFE
jgi:hypothetical protein